MRKSDKIMGDYSYPVYLLHWPAGAFASFWLYGTTVRGVGIPSLITFLVAMIVTFILASIAIFVIDRNIYSLRDRVRGRVTAGKIALNPVEVT